MARERYLIGVNPDELKKKETPAAPQTPQGKWENFWYHYKWLVIGLTAVALLIVVLCGQCAARTEPDYMICMVTTQEVGPIADARLEELLTPYANDRNGDGKVRVEVRCLNVSSGDGEYVNPEAATNQQAAMGHILVRDVDIWAVDPSFYTGTLRSAFDGDESKFFMPLELNAKNVSADKKYWNWKDLAILKNEQDLQTMPKTLYWGVRVLPDNASEALKAQVADMYAFLKAFAEGEAVV